MPMTVVNRRQLIVKTAKGEIGVKEQPDGSNSGARVIQYQRATFLGGTGWPWCIAWLHWVWREAGAPFPYRGAGAYNLLDWARSHGYATTTPKMGDGVIWNIGAGHGSLFVKFDGNNVITVDGNVSNEVAMRSRPKSLVRGYVMAAVPKTGTTLVPSGPRLFEVVTSESGTEKIVAVGNRFTIAKLVAGKSAYWLKRFGGYRVRQK